jgi:glycosyltransferase involved in cell wall biosynthesis
VAWGLQPDEIPLWMSAADALLLTSLSEGSPNVVKEAMAHELPVVSTLVGDVEERVRGVPACHAGPPEPDSLAAALVRAVSHGRVPEAREALAPLDRRVVAERVRSIYESAISG